MILADLLPAPASVSTAEGILDLNKAQGIQAMPGTDFIIPQIRSFLFIGPQLKEHAPVQTKVLHLLPGGAVAGD